MQREISLLGNEDEPIFRGYVLPDQPEFLVIFYKLFQAIDRSQMANLFKLILTTALYLDLQA